MRTKTKPKKFAPWLETPAGYAYRVAEERRKVEARDRKADVRWAKAKRVNAVSRKRRADMAAYAALRKVFLAGPPEVRCRCCAVNPATDVHHTRGRAGKLLLDVRYWLPLCRSCHRWVGENPEAARRLGERQDRPCQP